MWFCYSLLPVDSGQCDIQHNHPQNTHPASRHVLMTYAIVRLTSVMQQK